MMTSSRIADRQWRKLFFAAIHGRQKSWWLPSWRADLLAVSVGAGVAGVTAKLPLAPPLTNSGACDGLTIEALAAGTAGNLLTVTLSGDAIDTAGEFDDGGGDIVIRFVPTVTTDAQIKTLVNASSGLVKITGTTSGMALQSGDDEFMSVHPYGGIDASGSQLTIDTTASGGDFAAWYPQRDRLQIKQADGTITYTRILSAAAGVLALDASLSGSAVTLVSWLELVRLESDDVATTYTGATFSQNQQARVVQLRTDGAEVTFADYETSAESSVPREGIEIVTTAKTWRVATGDQNLTINGNLYTAAASQRNEIAVDVAGAPQSVQVTLPISHEISLRYLKNGIPPRQITINIYRQQPSGTYDQVWTGLVTSMAPDGHLARFLVPARTGDTMQRRLPTVTAGPSCGHVLFGPGCKVVRASFTVTTTVATGGANGATITVASIGGKPDHWADFGELVHVASGERMTIVSQIGATVEIQFPIAELKDGDAITVSAGCTHLIGPVVTTPPTVGFGCKDGFDNVVNFSNQPDLKSTRAYTTGSRGSTAMGNPRHQVP